MENSKHEETVLKYQTKLSEKYDIITSFLVDNPKQEQIFVYFGTYDGRLYMLTLDLNDASNLNHVDLIYNFADSVSQLTAIYDCKHKTHYIFANSYSGENIIFAIHTLYQDTSATQEETTANDIKDTDTNKDDKTEFNENMNNTNDGNENENVGDNNICDENDEKSDNCKSEDITKVILKITMKKLYLVFPNYCGEISTCKISKELFPNHALSGDVKYALYLGLTSGHLVEMPLGAIDCFKSNDIYEMGSDDKSKINSTGIELPIMLIETPETPLDYSKAVSLQISEKMTPINHIFTSNIGGNIRRGQIGVHKGIPNSIQIGVANKFVAFGGIQLDIIKSIRKADSFSSIITTNNNNDNASKMCIELYQTATMNSSADLASTSAMTDPITKTVAIDTDEAIAIIEKVFARSKSSSDSKENDNNDLTVLLEKALEPIRSYRKFGIEHFLVITCYGSVYVASVWSSPVSKLIEGSLTFIAVLDEPINDTTQINDSNLTNSVIVGAFVKKYSCLEFVPKAVEKLIVLEKSGDVKLLDLI